MKRIYLIRHGESEDNASNLESHDHTPLSEKGRKQAEDLARRFESISVDAIVSSPFVRTHSTAQEIARLKDKEIEFSELFVERRVPSTAYGKSFDSEEVKEVYAELNKNYFTPHARHSDEETFEDVKERARKALAHLESSDVDNIVVVTHGMFIMMLMAYMIFGENATGPEFLRMFRTFRNSNTGITWCEYDSSIKSDERTGWRIVAWNDHAHLG